MIVKDIKYIWEGSFCEKKSLLIFVKIIFHLFFFLYFYREKQGS